MAQLDVVVVESGIQQTSTKLDKLTESGKKAESASKNLAGQTSKTGYVVGQFGYQIQDAITQLEMGTSYFRVIGQQAPQALGALGAAGAIAGTAVSILAVAAGVLYEKFNTGVVSTDELKEAHKVLNETLQKSESGVISLTAEIVKLAETDKELANIKLAQAMLSAQTTIKAMAASVDEAAGSTESFATSSTRAISQLDDFDRISKQLNVSFSDLMSGNAPAHFLGQISDLNDYIDQLSNKFGISNEQALTFVRSLSEFENTKSADSMKKLADTVADINDKNGYANASFTELSNKIVTNSLSAAEADKTIQYLKKALDDVGSAASTSSAQISGATDEIAKMTQAADDAAFAIGKTRGEIAAHQAALKGADIVEQEYIKTRYDSVDAYNKQQEAQKKAASDAKSAAQEAERAAQQKKRADDANEAKIADAILKTQQLTQERDNLTNGTDRIVAGTSRYSQKTAELAAQQQLGATATGEQVKRLADQLLAQDKVTESIEKAKKAEEDKKKLSDFTSGFQKDAYDASDKTDLERQKKYHEDRLKQIEDNNNTEFAKSVEGRKMITDAKLAEDQRYNDMKSQIEQQAMLNTAASISSSLSYMTNAMSSAGKETTAMYRVIFAAQKAAAIPSMIISTQKAYLDTINNSGLGVWAIPLAETVRAAGYASIGVVAAQAIAGRAQGGQVIAGQTYNVGERGMETFTPSQNGWITPNGGNTNNISATNNVYNYAGVNVKTMPNESGGTDTYITRDEFADLMAVHGADPNSKFNRSRGTVYRQQRA